MLDYTQFPPEARTCKMSPNGLLVLPKGKIFYAHNAIKGQENNQGDLRYGVNLMVPPGADLQLAKRELYRVAIEKLKDKDMTVKAVNKRFIDPNNKPGGGKPEGAEWEGWTMMRLSSKYRPDFMFPNKQVCPESELERQVYSGRWIFVSAVPYWFDVGSNKGPTLGLQNVMLSDDDDIVGGGRTRASDDFADMVESSSDDAFGDAGSDSGFDDLNDDGDDNPF